MGLVQAVCEILSGCHEKIPGEQGPQTQHEEYEPDGFVPVPWLVTGCHGYSHGYSVLGFAWLTAPSLGGLLGQLSPDAQTCQQKDGSRGGLGSPWEAVLAPAQVAGLVHGILLGLRVQNEDSVAQGMWGENPPGLAVRGSIPILRSLHTLNKGDKKNNNIQTAL